jgi:hypothetical protein
MRKAQGALEYLIIIAAVLAIAAIVVLFITGAFKGATGGGDIAKCRLAATTCAGNLATGVYPGPTCPVTACVAACVNSAGYDLKAPTVLTTPALCVTGGTATACISCISGITITG